jgi:hypothetical protein
MVTALIIALAATAFILAAAILTVLTGWFPRLAVLAARGLERALPTPAPSRLDPRDRAELAARLWLTFLAL